MLLGEIADSMAGAGKIQYLVQEHLVPESKEVLKERWKYVKRHRSQYEKAR